MTPHVTVLGMRGGSPLAAAVNALLQLAEEVDG
jgi:precorrin isomerase